MTTGTIEEQTRSVIELIKETLKEANCELDDIVKSMVWLKSRNDFAGFNEVYGRYFPEGPPARSALVSDFLVDIKVELECIAYKPDYPPKTSLSHKEKSRVRVVQRKSVNR